MNRIAIALATLAVAACAAPERDHYRRSGDNPPVILNPGPPPANNLQGRSFTYGCEDLSTIVITEGSNSARATLNSGLDLQLARQPSGAGFRFGGGSSPYEFIGAGTDAVWRVAGKSFRCRLK
ncbi:hypothetical protein [Caenimonas koreensis]|uniref:hypothetical protein n=1 Tax=Caenimonas koreensis TaxID=367474 RepID=UPI0037831782